MLENKQRDFSHLSLPLSISLYSCQTYSKHTEFGSRAQSSPLTIVSDSPHFFYWW